MINLTRPRKNKNQMFRLYLHVNDISRLCDLIKFTPKKIMEIGVGTTDGFQSIEYILNEIAEAIIFEPHPKFYNDLKENLGHLPNLKIFNIGIYKESGIRKFYDKWACTFVGEMYDYSGAKIQDNYIQDEKDSFLCPVDTIDHYDNGDIDLLCMDCESCEWFVLEKLKSRPTVIQIETHSHYSNYHPYEFEKIKQWFKDNLYTVIASNESDCVIVKDEYLEKLGKIEFSIKRGEE